MQHLNGPKPPNPKPRLTCEAVRLLVGMHRGWPPAHDYVARHQLIVQNLVCYVDGWKLTKAGKQLARHLTGTK